MRNKKVVNKKPWSKLAIWGFILAIIPIFSYFLAVLSHQWASLTLENDILGIIFGLSWGFLFFGTPILMIVSTILNTIALIKIRGKNKASLILALIGLILSIIFLILIIIRLADMFSPLIKVYHSSSNL